MAVYPSTIAPDKGVEIQYLRPTIRATSEAGYTSTRNKYTSGRVLFTLSYSNITITEFQKLLEFFKSNQGKDFTYAHDDMGVITYYTVIFTMNEMPEEIPSSKLRNTRVTFITS